MHPKQLRSVTMKHLDPRLSTLDALDKGTRLPIPATLDPLGVGQSEAGEAAGEAYAVANPQPVHKYRNLWIRVILTLVLVNLSAFGLIPISYNNPSIV